MSNDKSYRSIDQLKQLVESILENYQESLVNSAVNPNGILPNLLIESEDFCKSLQSGELLLGNKLARGSVNFITSLKEKGGRQIWAQFNSFKHASNNWSIGYSSVIVRSTIDTKEPYIFKYVGDVLYLPDPIYDALIQGMITTLYTLSITPNVLNSFANYFCQDRGLISSYNIVEKASFSLDSKVSDLNRLMSMIISNTGTPLITPAVPRQIVEEYNRAVATVTELFTLENVVSWTMQSAWTTYVWKKYYGITNVDLHFGNILVCDTEDPQYSTMFDGKNMKNVEWLLYGVPGLGAGNETIRMAFRKTKYLLKLSDFGFSRATIPGKGPLVPPIKIRNSTPMIVHYHDYTFDKREDLFGTLEIAYIMRTFAVNMDKWINMYKLTQFIPILTEYVKFCKAIDPSFNHEALRWFVYPREYNFTNQLRAPGEIIPVTTGSQQTGLIRQRSWGIPNQPIEQPTRDGFKYLSQMAKDHGKMGTLPLTLRNINGFNILIVGEEQPGKTIEEVKDDRVAISYDPPELISYIQRSIGTLRQIAITCPPSADHPRQKELIAKYLQGYDITKLCANSKAEQFLVNPNNYIHDPIVSTTVNGTPGAQGTLRTIQQELVTNIDLFSLSLGQWNPVKPQQIATGPVTRRRHNDMRDVSPIRDVKMKDVTPDYINKYQVAPNTYQFLFQPGTQWGPQFNAMMRDDGEPLKTVVLEFVVPKPENDIRLSVASKYTLPRLFTERHLSYGVTGGYSIGELNGKNRFTPGIKKSDVNKPIGSFFDRSAGHDAVQTIVPIPLPYMKYFYCVIQKKDNTLSFHKYLDMVDSYTNVIYPISDDTWVAASIPVIGTKNPDYNKLFCIGPILIDKGKPLFDERMWTKKMAFNKELKELAKSPTITQQEFRKLFNVPEGNKLVDVKDVADGTPFVLYPTQGNFNLYAAESNESVFPYRLRNSNSLNVNAAICMTKEGKIAFAFSQGKGFGAPGLNKVQFTWLLSHFSFDMVIALDGGSNATAIVLDSGGNPKLLLSKALPEERPLSSGFLIK